MSCKFLGLSTNLGKLLSSFFDTRAVRFKGIFRRLASKSTFQNSFFLSNHTSSTRHHSIPSYHDMTSSPTALEAGVMPRQGTETFLETIPKLGQLAIT